MTQNETFDIVLEVRIMKKLLEEHLCGASQRNIAIWGIIATLFIQIVSFSYLYGQLTQRVLTNERAIDKIVAVTEKNAQVIQHVLQR